MDKTKLAVDIFDSYAVAYQEKYMSVDLYALSLNLFASKIKKKKAQLLDLACGPGNITHFLLNKHPDFDVLGTDLSPKMIALAKKNNPTARFELMDCREFYRIDQKFDGIICGFGLPYLSKEAAIQLIRNAKNQLHPKGLIYLSTMEDDYEKSTWVGPSSGKAQQLFMYFHQADYLCTALEENGFEIIEIERISYKGNDGKPVTDLILIGQKTA